MGQPIVDLATLDLSRAVVPDAELRTCLPHRHEFQLLDGICHFDPERGIAVAWKEWDAEPWWARGHVPGRPIMPGVLMIEMAAQISSVIYHLKFQTGGKVFFGFAGVNAVKFRGTVDPGQNLVMVVRAKALRSRMAIFEAQGFVEGKMVFEGEISGVVVG